MVKEKHMSNKEIAELKKEISIEQKKLDEILFYSIRKLSARGVKRAINKGASPLAIIKGRNPFQALAYYDQKYYKNSRSPKVLKNQMLIALSLSYFHADVDNKLKFIDGEPALLTFTKSGNKEMERFLVETCKANADIANDQGQTPLLFAVMKNDLDMVNFFLEHGANPNALSSDEYKNDYYSILEWLCYQENFSHDIFKTEKVFNKEEIHARLEIAQALVKAGANADKVNTQIITAPQIKTYIGYCQEVNASNRKESKDQTITTK